MVHFIGGIAKLKTSHVGKIARVVQPRLLILNVRLMVSLLISEPPTYAE